ncbi:pantoate--beta-alanine ligase [Candidatus Sumerlaeota bacterium]
MATTMFVARTIEEMRSWRAAPEVAGANVALVPTMGALHQGHMRLISDANRQAERVVVSIFVNPTQFGPSEDLDQYPRDFGNDEALCAGAGVDCIFYPTAEIMYPAGCRTIVEVEGISKTLEGQSRPNHFRGVTTVVLKLLNIVTPDVAVFGWKDAQQLIILRRMVADLDLPVQVVACETVREDDGLALSSRNTYLSAQQRREAPALYRALQMGGQMVSAHNVLLADIVANNVRDMVETESSGKVDYVAVTTIDTLAPLELIAPGNTLISLAVYFGETRLIDNIRL